MKNKKETFIPYKKYGLGLTLNMVLSFIEMYGNTYASNKHIGERLETSTKTISRSISKLEELGYIEIVNPKGRSRFVKMSNQVRHNVQDHRQNVPLNLDKLSNNNKENKKLNNKDINKVDNKDIKSIKPSNLLKELINNLD